MRNSHAWHGTTFDPNPPPLAPLAGSIKRPTKQISIAALSATPHLLLVVISRPQCLVVKYLAINLSLHSPRDLFHLQLPALSKLAAAPTRQNCLMLPGMDISRYLGKVQVYYFWCSIYTSYRVSQADKQTKNAVVDTLMPMLHLFIDTN